MCFSQYLIIWSGNLPEEIPFYIVRGKGAWGVLGMALLVLHFALPFSLLLSRRVKSNVGVMTTIAVLVLLMRFVDLFWYIGPTQGHGEDHLSVPFHIHWLDASALVGIGGIWVALFLKHLRSFPLLPSNDPRMDQYLSSATH